MSAIARDPVLNSTLPSDQRISAAGLERRSLHGRSSPFTAAVASGTIASLTTTAVLSLLARLEGRSIFQPANATRHWLHGEKAGHVKVGDTKHTLVGYCTHHLSAIFWAQPFEAWLSADRSGKATFTLRKAAITAAFAYLVDYHLVPKRLTPRLGDRSLEEIDWTDLRRTGARSGGGSHGDTEIATPEPSRQMKRPA
ncbi:hypothetical protein [Sinorhizobium americanum]|uniref:Uncharacterized protein n=1 Tax=Sinorhizobium americanum TaxID=194963 RepID=A0A4R2C1M7_9HYPH|nr:hypothetical protein [Sinorhizobium americanum]TCN33342.1 hypothetical protein EV184_103356 [Sinorhizobium americanum]